MRKHDSGTGHGLPWDTSGTLLGWFLYDFEMVFLMILGAVSDCFGVLLGFVWNDFNIGLDTIWGTCGLRLGILSAWSWILVLVMRREGYVIYSALYCQRKLSKIPRWSGTTLRRHETRRMDDTKRRQAHRRNTRRTDTHDKRVSLAWQETVERPCSTPGECHSRPLYTQNQHLNRK